MNCHSKSTWDTTKWPLASSLPSPLPCSPLWEAEDRETDPSFEGKVDCHCCGPKQTRVI